METAPIRQRAQAPERLGSTGALTIRVSRGTGTGRTRLSAFDAALHDAGVADFNLVQLSSVIPAGSSVQEVASYGQLVGEHGDALYCVYTDAYATTPGEQAWAGVAWSSHDDGSGAGLFVEHSGGSHSAVQHELDLSLEDLSRNRGGHYSPSGQLLTTVECDFHPVCAIVIATYQRAGWGGR